MFSISGSCTLAGHVDIAVRTPRATGVRLPLVCLALLGLTSPACGPSEPPSPAPETGADDSGHSGDDPTDDTDHDSTGGGDTGEANQPPELQPPDPVMARVGELLRLSLDATDPDGDPLTFSAEGLPGGAVLDAGTGVLTWTPTEAEVGSWDLTVSVSDGVLGAEAGLVVHVATAALHPVPLVGISDSRLDVNAAAPTDAPTTLRIVASPGEHEPARLALFADADWTGLSLHIPDLDGPGDAVLQAAALDVRTVKRWWQGGHDHVLTDTRLLVPELLLKDDTLVRTVDEHNEVRLADGTYTRISDDDSVSERTVVEIADFDVDDARDFVPIAIDAGENKVLWITLSVPEDQVPGVYETTLELHADEVPVAWLPLQIEVLPIALPPSDLTFSIYYRAELSADYPHGSISSEYKSEAQLQAELQSMQAHGITNPTVYQDPDSGDLFEDYLAIREALGMGDQPVYLVRANAILLGRSVDELKDDTRAVIATAQSYGATDVYFMGRDEAREEDLTGQREAWEAVRDVGGKVWAAGYRTTAWSGEGNFDLMGDIQDLLICAYRPSAQEAALWHGEGHRIMVYENPQGGLELPLLNRRNFGLLLWQEDYDGAMTYAFQDSFGDGWNDFDHEDERDFNFAYPTTTGVIDTIQYEGFREAVDDTRYLAALEDALETASAAGTDTTAPVAWLAELEQAPLARLDLDQLRDRMVGWTLHLTGQTVAGGPSLEIDSVEVSPLNRQGDLTIRWTTNRRATSQLLVSVDGGESWASEEEPALVRWHAVTLRGVDPDATLQIRARSVDSDGDEITSDPVDGGTGVSTAVALVSPTPADGATVSGTVDLAADIAATWAASALVDWDRSLLAWWRFSEATDEDAADSSSWGHDAIMSGGAGERVDGWSGQGLWLDGDEQYADAGDLGIPANGTATVEGWFRVDQLAVDKGSAGGLLQHLYIHPNNDHLYFRDTNDWFRSSSHLTPGVWHHLALAWSGDTSTAQLWVDGEALPINVQSGAESVMALDEFTIGRSYGYLEGAVDELRVWSRVLSDAEVKAAYDARRHGFEATLSDPGVGTIDYTVYAVDVDDEVVPASRTLTVE